jgi:cyclopropane-fatty-acyl-phospholipid synthase
LVDEMNRSEATVRSLFELADIEINGSQSGDIQINDKRFYPRVLSDAILGFGESYMDGWWDCDQLHVLVQKLVRGGIEQKIKPIKLLLPVLAAKLFNRQSRARAYEVAEHHYDLGNDMFQLMLDKRMVYTCAYWKDAKDLATAQEAKLDLVCKKIGLQNGMRVLDIGCGWGSFAKFAAENYGARVVGVSVSKEQTQLGREMCKGLDVDLRLQDYRDVDEEFDRVVSIGMFEAVGPKNFRTYMDVVHRCLTEDGIFLLHTIGTNTIAAARDPWTDKYIFPNGVLPIPSQLAKAVEGLFQIEDWHNLNVNYAKTLLAWAENFDRNWKRIEQLGYDQRFYRMWRFFLLSAAGSFNARRTDLWQVVYSKNGIEGGYEAIR